MQELRTTRPETRCQKPGFFVDLSLTNQRFLVKTGNMSVSPGLNKSDRSSLALFVKEGRSARMMKIANDIGFCLT
ncbi:hypothetical protein [Microseira wollei]|uniref:hypothetical protein n=1 Tax=Microseira wollei TaxID=467598 RepID=UPI001CFC4C5F|nr:hypothetical protein [Microseira wollei]